MTRSELFEQKIKESGIKKKMLLEKLGITYPTLRRKSRNISEFNAGEIETLCNILNLTQAEAVAIFFNNK